MTDTFHPDPSERFESLRKALLAHHALGRFQLADREDIIQAALNKINERYADRYETTQLSLAKRIALNEAWQRLREGRESRATEGRPRFPDLDEIPAAVSDPVELAEFRSEVARSFAEELSREERALIVRGLIGTERIAFIAADLAITERKAYRVMQSALSKMHFALREFRDLFA